MKYFVSFLQNSKRFIIFIYMECHSSSLSDYDAEILPPSPPRYLQVVFQNFRPDLFQCFNVRVGGEGLDTLPWHGN